MKRYKYIHIEKDSKGLYDGKPLYEIKNNKTSTVIGIIFYYKGWKQYVFNAKPSCVFNVGCMKDIIDFIDNEIK